MSYYEKKINWQQALPTKLACSSQNEAKCMQMSMPTSNKHDY